MGLVIRTIGLACATATVTLANMAYNMSDGAGCSGPVSEDEGLRPKNAAASQHKRPNNPGLNPQALRRGGIICDRQVLTSVRILASRSSAMSRPWRPSGF